MNTDTKRSTFVGIPAPGNRSEVRGKDSGRSVRNPNVSEHRIRSCQIESYKERIKNRPYMPEENTWWPTWCYTVIAPLSRRSIHSFDITFPEITNFHNGTIITFIFSTSLDHVRFLSRRILIKHTKNHKPTHQCCQKRSEILPHEFFNQHLTHFRQPLYLK